MACSFAAGDKLVQRLDADFEALLDKDLTVDWSRTLGVKMGR